MALMMMEMEIKILTYLECFDEYVVGAKNMFIENLLHYSDNDSDINVDYGENDDVDDDDEQEEEEEYEHDQMEMSMNVIDDNENGYVKSMIDLEGSTEDVVGTMNMFVGNSSHYGDNDDDVNIEDDTNKDGDDDEEEEEE